MVTDGGSRANLILFMVEMHTTDPTSKPVVYFSSEYAIADDMPIYAGGLGILAADIVLQAASQNLSFYALGLVYHEAFTGDDPDQRTMVERLSANGFELASRKNGERLTVKIQVADRPVMLQAWQKRWGKTMLILLDARLPENDERDRMVSEHLYASDPVLALAQEICLGFGGMAVLKAMGLKPRAIHLNEGHTAMAGLAGVLDYLDVHPGANFEEAVAAVKPRLVGTKHTILSGAGLLLDWNSVAIQLEPILAAHGATMDDLKSIATKKETGDFSGTKLMLGLVHVASGVSEIHVKEELERHPHSQLIPITNGIFRWRWTTTNWDGHPLTFDDERFWAIHCENRRQLLEHVRQQTGTLLDPEHLTVVWARRMAAYKRPELLVSNVARLAKLIHHSKRPIQFVVAGAANPADTVGLELVRQIVEAARRPDITASFAYLPHYNPVTAKFLVRGADLWLNTPVRGYEACGTSGMKASLNGALQLSTSDGWLDEVHIPSIGWRLPVADSATAVYDLLEDEVAPLFYDREGGLPRHWITKMRANMKLIQEDFTAERMLRDYYTKMYDVTLVKSAPSAGVPG
jgi:glycogen phosphorylase